MPSSLNTRDPCDPIFRQNILFLKSLGFSISAIARSAGINGSSLNAYANGSTDYLPPAYQEKLKVYFRELVHQVNTELVQFND